MSPAKWKSLCLYAKHDSANCKTKSNQRIWLINTNDLFLANEEKNMFLNVNYLGKNTSNDFGKTNSRSMNIKAQNEMPTFIANGKANVAKKKSLNCRNFDGRFGSTSFVPITSLTTHNVKYDAWQIWNEEENEKNLKMDKFRRKIKYWKYCFLYRSNNSEITEFTTETNYMIECNVVFRWINKCEIKEDSVPKVYGAN